MYVRIPVKPTYPNIRKHAGRGVIHTDWDIKEEIGFARHSHMEDYLQLIADLFDHDKSGNKAFYVIHFYPFEENSNYMLFCYLKFEEFARLLPLYENMINQAELPCEFRIPVDNIAKTELAVADKFICKNNFDFII